MPSRRRTVPSNGPSVNGHNIPSVLGTDVWAKQQEEINDFWPRWEVAPGPVVMGPSRPRPSVTARTPTTARNQQTGGAGPVRARPDPAPPHGRAPGRGRFLPAPGPRAPSGRRPRAPAPGGSAGGGGGGAGTAGRGGAGARGAGRARREQLGWAFTTPVPRPRRSLPPATRVWRRDGPPRLCLGYRPGRLAGSGSSWRPAPTQPRPASPGCPPACSGAAEGAGESPGPGVAGPHASPTGIRPAPGRAWSSGCAKLDQNSNRNGERERMVRQCPGGVGALVPQTLEILRRPRPSRAQRLPRRLRGGVLGNKTKDMVLSSPPTVLPPTTVGLLKS